MKNIIKTVCMFLFTSTIVGCVSDRNFDENCVNGICTNERSFEGNCITNSSGYDECQDVNINDYSERNVNYTKTEADFRKYGERSPRDRRITQAGAGNNISASIRPTIDNEVIDYEASYSEMGRPVAERAAEELNPNRYPLPAEYRESQNKQEQKPEISDTQEKDWLVEEGDTLKDLLTKWSEESGWRLIWKTNRNYTVNAGAMFRGNFADVASALVRAFARAKPAPIATYYKGNKVLIIETMEDENAFN